MKKINPKLDIIGELDNHIDKTKFKDIEKYKAYKIETYRQFIKLIGGDKALQKADEYVKNQLNIERTNRMLEIADANKFNKAILETAILDNV